MSHDRALLDAVGTRTIAVEERSLRSYVGGWPEYVRVRDERRAGTPASNGSLAPAPGANGANGSGGLGAAEAPRAQGASGSSDAADALPEIRKAKPRQKPKGPSKNRLSEQQKAERAIEAAEAALHALEGELADPAAWATRYEAAKSEARHTAATRAVDTAYARLEALVN